MTPESENLRERVLRGLFDLARQEPRRLVQRAGFDTGDLSALEEEALALFAFAFLWGRLAGPDDGPAAEGGGQVQVVARLVDEPAFCEAGRAEPGRPPEGLNPKVERTRTLFARHAAGLLADLRHPGIPERDPAELLMAAAQSYVFFDHVAFGESREKFALRSVIAYQEARRASGALRGGGGGPETDAWAARWKRIIPMLREEIASSRTDPSRPGHVVAELAALRVFHRASAAGAFNARAAGTAIMRPSPTGPEGFGRPDRAPAPMR